MKVFDIVLDLLFPLKCPFCHHLLKDGEQYLCAECQKNLPWSSGPQGEQNVEFLSGCVSPLFYRENVPDGVHRFKFQNRPGYAKPFGLLMAQSVRDAWPDVTFDAVTCVPLSWLRYRTRGYNQAELLAQEVAGRLALPFCPTLVKKRHTFTQSTLNKDSARKANVLGAYRMARKADVAGKTILLCDDVVTTGSTLSECARVLRTAGAAKIYAVTLARARK